MESPHEFNVEGFERVASRLNKVDTSVNTIIDNIRPVWFILRFKIRIKSRLDTFQNGFPTTRSALTLTIGEVDLFFIIDEISKSRGMDDIKSQSNAILLNIGTDSTDIHRLRNFHRRRSRGILGRVQTRVKQRIHQSRFAQSRLTCNVTNLRTNGEKGSEVQTTMTLKLKPLRTDLQMPLIGQVCESNVPS